MSIGAASHSPALAAFTRTVNGNMVTTYYVAWQRTTNQEIRAAAFDNLGNRIGSEKVLDDRRGGIGQQPLQRRNVSLSVNRLGVIAAAWEEFVDGDYAWIAGTRCTRDFNNCQFLDAGCGRCLGGPGREKYQKACTDDDFCSRAPGSGPLLACITHKVSCPPRAPFSAQATAFAAVAIDEGSNVSVTWQGSVNHVDAWNIFARGFASDGSVLVNDHRIDLADHASAAGASVTATNIPGEFIYAWSDDREGKMNVYMRRRSLSAEP